MSHLLKYFAIGLTIFTIVWCITTISIPSIYEEECQRDTLENAQEFTKYLGENTGGLICTDRMVSFYDSLCYLKTKDEIIKLSCSYRKNKGCTILSDKF